MWGIWRHLLKKSLMGNFIFCAVYKYYKQSTVTQWFLINFTMFYDPCVITVVTNEMGEDNLGRLISIYDKTQCQIVA